MTYGVDASYADARLLLLQWSGQHPPWLGSTSTCRLQSNGNLVVYCGTLTSLFFVHY